jgi:MoxR-like ATPase
MYLGAINMNILTDFAAFKQHLVAAGYADLTPEPFLQGYLALQDLRPDAEQVSAMLFDGEPGTGKTYFAGCVAKMLSATLLRHQMTPDAGAEQLLYDLHLPRIIQGMAGMNIPTSYRDLLSPGILVQAFEASLHGPTILLLDELDKALPEVDSYLLGCLQDRAIHNPHAGTQRCNPANLLVIITKNDHRSLNDALMRRVRRVYTKYPPAEQECALILRDVPSFPREVAMTLVTLANRLRQQKDKALKVPSTPELIRCARDLLVAPTDLAGAVVEQWLIAFPSDRTLLKESRNELSGLFKYVRGKQ